MAKVVADVNAAGEEFVTGLEAQVVSFSELFDAAGLFTLVLFAGF